MNNSILNSLFQPGTTVPVVDCQNCRCTWDKNPETKLFKIDCTPVDCDEKCETVSFG